MDAEDKKLLLETHALARDTHVIIRQMRREQWFGFFFKMVIWIIVLGVPVYLFTAYLNPLLTQLAPPGAPQHYTGWFGLPSSADVQKLIDSYKTKQ